MPPKILKLLFVNVPATSKAKKVVLWVGPDMPDKKQNFKVPVLVQREYYNYRERFKDSHNPNLFPTMFIEKHQADAYIFFNQQIPKGLENVPHSFVTTGSFKSLENNASHVWNKLLKSAAKHYSEHKLAFQQFAQVERLFAAKTEPKLQEKFSNSYMNFSEVRAGLRLPELPTGKANVLDSVFNLQS